MNRKPKAWTRATRAQLERLVKCHLWGPEDLLVLCPYCPEFGEKAKALGGRFVWHMTAWRFPPEKEDAVRILLHRQFGTDGSEDVEYERVLVRADRFPENSELWACSQRVAWRTKNGGDLLLAANAHVLVGGFTAPRFNRALGAVVPTVIELLWIPEILAWQETRRAPEQICASPVGSRIVSDFDPYTLRSMHARPQGDAASIAPRLVAFPVESVVRELARVPTQFMVEELKERLANARTPTDEQDLTEQDP